MHTSTQSTNTLNIKKSTRKGTYTYTLPPLSRSMQMERGCLLGLVCGEIDLCFHSSSCFFFRKNNFCFRSLGSPALGSFFPDCLFRSYLALPLCASLDHSFPGGCCFLRRLLIFTRSVCAYSLYSNNLI